MSPRRCWHIGERWLVLLAGKCFVLLFKQGALGGERGRVESGKGVAQVTNRPELDAIEAGLVGEHQPGEGSRRSACGGCRRGYEAGT